MVCCVMCTQFVFVFKNYSTVCLLTIKLDLFCMWRMYCQIWISGRGQDMNMKAISYRNQEIRLLYCKFSSYKAEVVCSFEMSVPTYGVITLKIRVWIKQSFTKTFCCQKTKVYWSSTAMLRVHTMQWLKIKWQSEVTVFWDVTKCSLEGI
jgi:hypothetical protein